MGAIVIFGRERVGLNGWCLSSLFVLVWQSWRIVVSSINSRIPRASPPLFAVVPSPQHPPRSLPFPLLSEKLPPSQSPTKTAPPSAHPSTQWPSRTPTMATESSMGMPTSGTNQTPTPRTGRCGKSAVNLLRYFAHRKRCNEGIQRQQKSRFFMML